MVVLAICSSVQSTLAASNVPSYAIGPMEAYPILNFATGYSSNIIEGDESSGSSPYVDMRAGGGIQGKNRGHLYGIEYELSGTWYSDSSDDSYIDHRLSAYGGHAFDVRNHVDGGIELKRGNDPRSQDFVDYNSRYSIGADEPDEWDQSQIGGNYTFGAPNAKGKIEVDACYTCRRFNNNDQDYRDYDITDVGMAFYGQVRPKTYLVAGASYSIFDYLNEDQLLYANSLDSEEIKYFLGTDWDITPKTRLRGRVGYLEKNFDDNINNDDYAEPYWEVDAIWAPRTTSTVALGFSRRTYESVPYNTELENEFNDDFAVVEKVDLDWSQQWSAKLASSFNTFYSWEDWSPSTREDERYGAYLQFDYIINRWFTVGAGAYYSKRDSNFDEHDYEDTGFMLSLNLGGGLGWYARAPAICRLRD